MNGNGLPQSHHRNTRILGPASLTTVIWKIPWRQWGGRYGPSMTRRYGLPSTMLRSRPRIPCKAWLLPSYAILCPYSLHPVSWRPQLQPVRGRSSSISRSNAAWCPLTVSFALTSYSRNARLLKCRPVVRIHQQAFNLAGNHPGCSSKRQTSAAVSILRLAALCLAMPTPLAIGQPSLVGIAGETQAPPTTPARFLGNDFRVSRKLKNNFRRRRRRRVGIGGVRRCR